MAQASSRSAGRPSRSARSGASSWGARPSGQVVAVAATGELLSTRSGQGVQARSVGKHASYIVTRHDRRAHGHAQDTTHPWSRARLRVSSVAVMACHGKVQPTEPQDPRPKDQTRAPHPLGRPAHRQHPPRQLRGCEPVGRTCSRGRHLEQSRGACGEETGAMSRGYTDLRANKRSEGLWPLSAEPGPSFRWGAVLRRSRLNSDGTEGSTARQERAIQAYVKANGMGRVVAVYSDIASAHNEKARRPDFENALADIRAGRIDGIIAWKVDRLTRRRSQARKLLTILEKCGGRLATVVEGIDTADPAKREITEIALAIYAGSAESESEAIGERVALMHLDRARKGLFQPSSVRPYGHTEDCKTLVPTEVEVLHEAAERLFAGEASFGIAADFTAREIPKPSGKTHWNSHVLRRMLLSPRMIGKREYGGTLYDLEDGAPIFDEATWEKLCAVLAKRGAHSGPM
ncbi:MAG TPA: recombinase family protein, partial [Actinomycetes bacterium]|nr:recombinase family protein [Actinomycetes bacterium]